MGLLRLLQADRGNTLARYWTSAAGTGRLLIPYLALGIDIEGVDTSEEALLAICRDRSAAQGLSPVLHRQHMQTLELSSRYRAIILPGGTFHLVGDPGTARESLRRFYDHLEPGGILAMSLDDPQRELGILCITHQHGLIPYVWSCSPRTYSDHP